jgi:hypothetical protein
MRGPRPLAILLVTTFVATGCYHQVVATGATPGGTVIERPWTATYVFGLVPAEAISTAAECPSGVAIVETQQTFPNGLVGVLTLGIYTPQTVRITCAASGAGIGGSRGIDVAANASLDEKATAVRRAIDLAHRTGESVAVYTNR